jgi:hypothetical protein
LVVLRQRVDVDFQLVDKILVHRHFVDCLFVDKYVILSINMLFCR